MSKWRPSLGSCLYVIPDLHGSYNMLEKICSRILPLRKTDGVLDKIVFLGDYIDRNEQSHMVLDKMIQLKKDYGENIICLLGNHELLLLETLDMVKNLKCLGLTCDHEYPEYFVKDSHSMWLLNGGFQTLYGYMKRAGIDNPIPNTLPPYRVSDFIPQEHQDFLFNLEPYYEMDDFIFVHASCDPFSPLKSQDITRLTWDRTMLKMVKKSIQTNVDLPWNKILITGHCHNGPVINSKYMMLDCGAPKKLLLTELNSMKAFMVYPNKNRMVKYEMTETVIKKTMFRRVQ